MSIRKLRAGRVPTVNVMNYIGEHGSIFWDEAAGILRLSDGTTPGGSIIKNPALAASSVSQPLYPFEGMLWYNPSTKELWAYHAGQFRGTINPATSTELGGIKAGPGVVVASDGTLSLDSTGIPFSFGDFYAFTNPGAHDGACLSSINLNQDVNLVSNGTGQINVVGVFNVHKTNTTVEDALSATPIFSVDADGQTKIIVPTTDPNTGAVEIIGSLSGASQGTVNTGVMLHITGNNGDASRLYNDGVGNFAAFVARRYNGTALLPTAVLANEEIMRISGTAHNGTSIPGTGNQRIVYRALGNQTLTNQGGSMEFWTTPINTTTLSKIATVDSVGITLESGKVLTGNVTGNVSGTAGSVAAANITGTTLASNVVSSSLTSVGTLSSMTSAGAIRYDVAQNNATVTQLTSKATTVVCNGLHGQITTSNSSLAKGAAVTFTVTNSAVTAVTDVPVVAFQSGATIDSYAVSVTRVQVGSFNITITNNSTGPLTDTIIINFAIIKVS